MITARVETKKKIVDFAPKGFWVDLLIPRYSFFEVLAFVVVAQLPNRFGWKGLIASILILTVVGVLNKKALEEEIVKLSEEVIKRASNE